MPITGGSTLYWPSLGLTPTRSPNASRKKMRLAPAHAQTGTRHTVEQAV